MAHGNEDFDFDGNAMGLSFDQGFDFDNPTGVVEEQEEQPIDDPNPEEPQVLDTEDIEDVPPQEPQLDPYAQLLDTMGFDYTSVEGEDGEDIPFENLSDEDKLYYVNNAIETYKQTVSDTLESQDQMTLKNALQDDEKELLLEVRKFGGVQKYVDAVLNEGTRPKYEIDDINDDELWVNHWKIQHQEMYKEGRLTDQMLEDKLARIKEDPLFKQETNNLRDYYEALEDRKEEELAQKQQEEDLAYRQQELRKFQHEMIETAKQVNEFMGVDVSDVEFKNDVLGDIVEYDENGTNEFLRNVLSDPIQMYMAAAFLKHGDSILQNIHAYYAEEFEKLKENMVTKEVTDRQSFIDKRPKTTRNTNKEEGGNASEYTYETNSLTENDPMEF